MGFKVLRSSWFKTDGSPQAQSSGKTVAMGLFQLGAIPGLLILVALRQIFLVHTAGLSPWHGGGFGMFASVDRDERRVFTATLTDCGGQTWPLSLAASPALLSPEAYTHIITAPSQARLEALAKRLLYSQPQASNGQYSAVPANDGCRRQATVQVWRLQYSDGSLTYEPASPLVEVEP